MKAEIRISGGINGNQTLNSAIPYGYSNKVSKGRFNSITISFRSLAEARSALKVAWERLKQDEPEYCSNDFNARLNRLKGVPYSIVYDASKAVIETID